MQLVLLALEEAIAGGIISEGDVTQEKLEGFLSKFGRSFYKLPDVSLGPRVVFERRGEVVAKSIVSAEAGVEVGLSRAGAEIFSLSW